MKTSTAQQQRKYSIFSSEDSESDSPGYVDVSRENNRKHETTMQQTKQPPLKQRLHVDAYELDSSSDFSRVDYVHTYPH